MSEEVSHTRFFSRAKYIPGNLSAQLWMDSSGSVSVRETASSPADSGGCGPTPSPSRQETGASWHACQTLCCVLLSGELRDTHTHKSSSV